MGVKGKKNEYKFELMTAETNMSVLKRLDNVNHFFAIYVVLK